MYEILIQLSLFTAKALIIVLLILFLLITLLTLIAKAKEKLKEGRITIRNLKQKYTDITQELLHEILPKKLFKKFLKEKKAEEKAKRKSQEKPKNVFVLNFSGDIKASAVTALREEVTALLSIAKPEDEIVVCLESAGGMVHAYGLAAAQLLRIRTKQIPLTICIDKIAASGGYMMACVANKILAAPFSIIGSIGVIVQLPNFNRYLKQKNIDFEQHMVGEYKRTITVFGENTDEGREKLHQELEDIHRLFKNLISEHRQQIDMQKIATGEHWLGKQALELKLIDEIKTSDDYLLECAMKANLYEICYEVKKPLSSRFAASAQMIREKILRLIFQPTVI